MGFEYYFINETTEEIVSSKVVSDGFEDSVELMEWLKNSLNCRVMIVGQDEEIIEKHMEGKALIGFKYIDLREEFREI